MAKKSQKILSISVAAYNLGEMIEDNLKSFCDDRYIDDIEVLVVDDGSTDDTPKRVEKYVKKYPNSIRLIKQKNAGPGSTVNTGIKNATGKYFRMVDGDDWVNKDDFANLIEHLKTVDADAVFTNYVPYHNVKKELLTPVVISDMPVGEVFKFNDYHYSYNPPIRMHHSIFRTDIMKKHVKLDNGFYTDSQSMFYPTPYIKTAVYYDLNIYIYRVALAGQRTSPEKMRRNRANHRFILDQDLAFYKKVVDKLEPGVRSYLALQMTGLVINHFDIIVLINDENMTKDIKALFEEMKQYPDIYEHLRHDKKFRITAGGKAPLVKALSIYLRQRYKHL